MNTPEKTGFDFWNDHSLIFLEMAMKRDFQERVQTCDAKGSATRGCGDTIHFFLMADQGQISAISYDIQGCIYTHACANALIMLVKDKDMKSAAAVNEADIIAYLETLPENEHHCADLVIKAFGRALSDLNRH